MMLKPCPFCGFQARIEAVVAFNSYGLRSQDVHKVKCGCGIETDTFRRADEAIYFWNKRVVTK